MFPEMRQGFFKNSFSIVIWPILRSSSATRRSSFWVGTLGGRFPLPGKAASPRARHSARQRSNSLGLTSSRRATCPHSRRRPWPAWPRSSAHDYKHFGPSPYLISIQCTLALNSMSHFWGAVHGVPFSSNTGKRMGHRGTARHPTSGSADTSTCSAWLPGSQ